MWTNSYTLEQTGEFLRDVRRARGIRQDEFARQLGVSHTTLSNLEKGKNTSTKTLERALQYLGLRVVIVPKGARVSVSEE
jgi:HTH-type transcriptional regulator/antitoxin HipB